MGREWGVGDGFELGVSDRQRRQLVFVVFEGFFDQVVVRDAQMTPKWTTANSNGRKQTEMDGKHLKQEKAFEMLDFSSISKAFLLAGAEGLEPTTLGFGDQYSTN